MGVGKDALLLINSFLIFCREKPKISAISDIPTKSGVASINLASGITLFTLSIWSTPKNAGSHGKQIKRVVDNCTGRNVDENNIFYPRRGNQQV
jgi:hypothetical protein